ncbi:MAG: NAD(P)H-hydrate epimerase [Planctomycetota bacterium]|jgi:NAD(P)H-hydrate epimerase
MDSPSSDAGGPGLTRLQSREVDRLALEQFGLSGLVLMENAGLLAALRCLELRQGSGPVVILCGSGNNGGDGYVVARQLALRGVPVQVLALGAMGDCSPDARVQRSILGLAGQAVLELDSSEERLQAWRDWQGCSLLVDALLGTGFRGQLREPLRELLRALTTYKEKEPCPVVALDLPSGLDCDTGQAAEGCVAADHTLSFAARKRAFDQPGSEAWTGAIEILPIGAPRAVFEALQSSFKTES